MGAGAGYATVEGTVTQSVNYQGFTGRYDRAGSVRTLMLTALIGYFHTTKIGFSIGIDAGAQLPIAPSRIEDNTTVTGDLAAIPANQRAMATKAIDDSVRDTLEKIGRTTLPTVNLRIGWIL